MRQSADGGRPRRLEALEPRLVLRREELDDGAVGPGCAGDAKDQPEPPAKVGDVIVFDGRKRHRGQGNRARSHVRAFFYIAAYSGGDPNTHE